MAEDLTPEGVEPEVVEDIVTDTGVEIAVEDMTDDDALRMLISAKPVRATRKVAVPMGEEAREVPLTLRSLNDPEIKEIRKAAEKPLNREQRRRGEEPELDDDLYRRLIIVNGVQSPKLNNPELLAAHGCARGEQLVEKLFLSGQKTILFAKIMEVSGYSEEAVRELGEG